MSKGIVFSLLIIFMTIRAVDCRAEQLKSVVLKKSAAAVRDDQVETLRLLDGALERLRHNYKPARTALSTAYEDWRTIYNNFAGHIDDADKRIGEFERNAQDLFTEWAQEAETMSDSGLKGRSLSKLEDTRERYSNIHQHLVERRASAQKIIVQLRDRVLFIKHSLNAESLEVLREEANDIETDMEDMRDDMVDALDQLNSFIVTLP